MAALAAGDIDALLDINREEFSGHFMMADEDDDDEDGDDDDASGDADDAKKKSKKSKDSGSDGNDDDDDDDADSELEKARKRMKAADKRADEAERKLREREDKDKTELERAQSAVEEFEKQIESMTETVNSLRLENAFLTANDHSWHDPDDALDVAQRKGYLEDVVNDDGEVDKKALKKALDRLAKEKSYLIVKKSDADDNDDDADEPSGEPAGGRSNNGKDSKAKRAQLQKRFPALNR
jgi:hypothetical protein